jgi:DNA-binding transcriptional MerR regulator
MSRNLTIGEASEAVGLSADAIRFYEREGVLMRPPRTSGGRRAYGPAEIQELVFIARLRAVRMPLPEIGRYLALARQGEGTLAERTRIVAVQRERVLAQIASLQETLGILDFKLAHAAELGAEHAANTPERKLQVISGGRDHG